MTADWAVINLNAVRSGLSVGASVRMNQSSLYIIPGVDLTIVVQHSKKMCFKLSAPGSFVSISSLSGNVPWVVVARMRHRLSSTTTARLLLSFARTHVCEFSRRMATLRYFFKGGNRLIHWARGLPTAHKKNATSALPVVRSFQTNLPCK